MGEKPSHSGEDLSMARRGQHIRNPPSEFEELSVTLLLGCPNYGKKFADIMAKSLTGKRRSPLVFLQPLNHIKG